jgi:hypothetical protein
MESSKNWRRWLTKRLFFWLSSCEVKENRGVRTKKATTLPDQVKVLEEITERGGRKKDDCSDGVNCHRPVSEEELPTMLAQGWHVVAVLPSGKIVVSNEK